LSKRTKGKFVKVRLRASHHSLKKDQVYTVLGIEADDYRLINCEDEPCLYSPKLFDIVDPDRPSDWIVEFGEDGEEFAYPSLLNRIGFFEDWHDGDSKTRREFARYIESIGLNDSLQS